MKNKKLPKHMKYATGITRAQLNGDRDHLMKVDVENRINTERPLRIKQKLEELKSKAKEEAANT